MWPLRSLAALALVVIASRPSSRRRRLSRGRNRTWWNCGSTLNGTASRSSVPPGSCCSFGSRCPAAIPAAQAERARRNRTPRLRRRHPAEVGDERRARNYRRGRHRRVHRHCSCCDVASCHAEPPRLVAVPWHRQLALHRRRRPLPARIRPFRNGATTDVQLVVAGRTVTRVPASTPAKRGGYRWPDCRRGSSSTSSLGLRATVVVTFLGRPVASRCYRCSPARGFPPPEPGHA